MSNEEHIPLLLDGPSDDAQHPINSNLVTFRNAIGINVHTSSSNPQEIENARSKPKGLYKEIIQMQRSRTRNYYCFEVFYYCALIAQILIGAILAALGSLASTHPTVITVLGILNTATAGILALLKGQGLPDRLRKDAYQMKKVQDFIEETDIRLAIGEELHPAELDAVVEKVFEMYNTARDTAEMNHPSNYAHQVDASETSPRSPRGRVPPGGHDGSVDESVKIRSVNRMAVNGAAGNQAKGKYVID
ncbi:uncharacterized protein PAC_02192 [Phialocephala subalpina]|uniref:SMODS and SLOG-associating 2TM effector domain-containing protein n=1 Tax=Phialocephala subalpina TaxID=576137 RepID=A0A1L7WHR0_9HELO|nr:uncharacterized protein PAC_02192 [Phialocephala subalpina]